MHSINKSKRVVSCEVSDNNIYSSNEGIFAPANHDPALLQKVHELRAAGHTVVAGLDTDTEAVESENCTKILVCENGQWMIK